MFDQIFRSLSNINILIILITLYVILLIIPGVYLLYLKHKYNYTTNGIITNSDCVVSPLNNTKTVCNLKVNYPANNRQYTGIDVGEEGNYTTGQNIPVYYNSGTPRSFIVKHYQTKTFGIVIITLGIILILMNIIIYKNYYV
jgi:hypothetical protein